MTPLRPIAGWLALAALLLFGASQARAVLQASPDDATVEKPPALTGIGAVLGADGPYVKIMQVVPGGPADRDGQLKINDRIAGVAQANGDFVDCSGMPLNNVVAMIRGAKGTTVRLQVIPAGAADPTQRKVISLVRDTIKLDAGLSSKLADTTKKIAGLERKSFEDSMKKTVDDVVRVTGLDDIGRKALEQAAAKAIDQCLAQSQGRIGDLLRSQMKQVPMNAAGWLSQIESDGSSYANWVQMSGGDWPQDQPAWTGGLKQTFTVEQAAAWDAAEAKRKAAAEKEMGDYLKRVADYVSDQERRGLDQKVSQVQVTLNLPQDRVAKLTTLEETVLTHDGEEAEARARKALLAMDEDDRQQSLKDRNYDTWTTPEKNSAWDDGLAKVLSADELQRIQDGLADRKQRRLQAFGDMLLALLDEKIAFTDAQRQQLQPLTRRLVQNEPGLYDGDEPESYGFYSVSKFYSVAATASRNEIGAILDPVQMRHWIEVPKMKNLSDPTYEETVQQLPSPENSPAPQPPPEPEDVERAISDYLNGKAAQKRDAVLYADVLKAEDVARVVHLPDDAAGRLATAARGEADAELADWKLAAERVVRSNIGSVTPDTVKERLASLPEYQFQDNFLQPQGRGAGHPSLWDQTLDAILSPDQLKAWQKETGARTAYRQKAIASMVISAFDKVTGLSADQWAKLEPLVEKIESEYSADFGRFFANSQLWFLQSFVTYLPLAGIPENDMKAILTKDQWERWTETNEFANATNYWNMINQNHQPRASH
jgi:hypothetical protein